MCKTAVNAEKSNINLNLINMNCDTMKEQLCEKIDLICQKLIDYQGNANAKHTQWICDEFYLMETQLIKPLSNTEDIVEQTNTLKNVSII